MTVESPQRVQSSTVQRNLDVFRCLSVLTLTNVGYATFCAGKQTHKWTLYFAEIYTLTVPRSTECEFWFWDGVVDCVVVPDLMRGICILRTGRLQTRQAPPAPTRARHQWQKIPIVIKNKSFYFSSPLILP